MIRRATAKDASRIAEISIFTKRMNYRSIFHDDIVSFNDMQVYPLAKEYIDNPDKLDGIWVYEDEFVKGFMNLDGKEITELYVDSFFENQGIGGKLVDFAIEKYDSNHLWVLEKNTKARRFYGRYGFIDSGNKRLEEGTTEYIVELKR